MSEKKFESALVHSKAPQREMAVGLSEISDRGMIDLRGDINDKKFRDTVKSVTGTDLPKKPRTSVSDGQITILWLSVDQWLICCPRDRASTLHQQLVDQLGDIHSLAVDVSDARAIIRIDGPSTKEVLMKAIPVDLFDPECGKGFVRRVAFAEIAALIHILDDAAETIDLFVFRSYAAYAWEWLCTTGTKASDIRLFGAQELPKN